MRRPATETARALPAPVLTDALLSAPALPVVLLVLFALHAQAVPLSSNDNCAVRAQLPAGWLCGVQARAGNETRYASFLGVPYAKQPVGELRFKELQALEPWDDFYDATAEGPMCPQHDVLYGPLNAGTMDEACIYANVHVPLYALPGYHLVRFANEPRLPHETGLVDKEDAGLPILVFIHGGAFAFGSGGKGLHGPDYLMPKDVIVITFNYRINVLGFLSLNNSYVPGNNGLKDMVTLLRWVQENARAFGGNPNDVTIAGQSAGAVCTHLLTLSKAAHGLFSRAIIMSGTAISGFYTPSPIYAQLVANMFLTMVGINSTDPEDVNRKLIDLPIDKIMEVNKQIQDQFGITAFTPVVETAFPGVTAVLDDNPEVLIRKGCGDHIPLIIGFTNAECEVFRRNFEEIHILQRIKDNPIILLPINLIYSLPPNVASNAVKRIRERYFEGEPTVDEYIQICTDGYYKHPAIELAMMRRANGAPAFLYEYSYAADFSAIEEIRKSHYKSAEHMDDLTFLFRAQALEDRKGFTPLSHRDRSMVDWMTMFVKNFIVCDDPSCSKGTSSPWLSVTDGRDLRHQLIHRPDIYQSEGLSEDQKKLVEFFDGLKNSTG